MNLILFDEGELAGPLPRSDPRAVHLLDILHRRVGEPFDAGRVNGPRGKGAITALGPGSLSLRFDWGPALPPLPPLVLLAGLPRPQTARRILQEGACLGVAEMRFFQGEKGEPGYASSTLWSGGEWRRRLLDGAAQAFDTRLPEVGVHDNLPAALAAPGPVPAAGRCLIALDNYEAGAPLLAVLERSAEPTRPLVLAVGPERGWSARERDLLRAGGFTLADLGPRVLRVETAVIAAVAVAKARLGWA